MYRAKVVTTSGSSGVIINEIAFSESLLEVLTSLGLETSLNLLLSNENACSLLVGRLLWSCHHSCSKPSHPSSVLLARTWILTVLIIVVVMTTHYKVVSVDLAALCRLHQFVGLLRGGILVFEVSEGDLIAAILLLLLVLSKDGI